MSVINDARRAALAAGEGALLPALPRIRGAGTAALRDALQAAAAMEEMQLSNPVSTSGSMEAEGKHITQENDVQPEAMKRYSAADSRAALHHALKR